jgi:hypothetical protein
MRRVYAGSVGLADELERVAAAAAAHGEVTGVLAAEPTGGRRHYLLALGVEEARAWLVVDEATEPVAEREVVREVASLVVMCELAEEVAGGGDLEQLRQRLAELRMTEQPPGIEAAEEAALELERALGAPPRVASPGYLDRVGAATRALEEALGQHSSPFAAALRSAGGAVESFLREVETRYRLPLR